LPQDPNSWFESLLKIPEKVLREGLYAVDPWSKISRLVKGFEAREENIGSEQSLIRRINVLVIS
jgi:hypothetical protein